MPHQQPSPSPAQQQMAPPATQSPPTPPPPADAAAAEGPARWEFVAVPAATGEPTAFPEEAPFSSSGCSTPRAEPGLPEHLCQAEALQRVAAALEQWRSRGRAAIA
mmetsp:Transcript_51424/g.129834  ORF Transcript_51424/g.129834 Transcript_51424/m.129834 type:complete len:106 (+) Transcript_51424:951-1268(+)